MSIGTDIMKLNNALYEELASTQRLSQTTINILLGVEIMNAKTKHPIFAKTQHHALCILTEEVGEIAQELNNPTLDVKAYRTEILQVMVVCQRMLEQDLSNEFVTQDSKE
jgi:hypothetical protein